MTNRSTISVQAETASIVGVQSQSVSSVAQSQSLGVSVTHGGAVNATVLASNQETHVAVSGSAVKVGITENPMQVDITPASVIATPLYSLSGLVDVDVAAAQSGNVLRYAGDKWRGYAETNLTDGGNF